MTNDTVTPADEVSTVTPAQPSEVAQDGTDGPTPDEGTEVDYRAAYMALKGAHETLSGRFADYRRRVVEVATRRGNQLGGCGEVDRAIAEIDPVMKRATFGGRATVTLKLSFEVTDSRNPVDEASLWNGLGNLAYEVANRRGDVSRVHKSAGVAEVVEPFTMVSLDTNTEMPEYVSPAEWAAQEEERRAAQRAKDKAERERRQAEGYYGTCDECDTNLTFRDECPNSECDEFVNRDEDGNRIYED